MNTKKVLEKDNSHYMVNLFWRAIPPIWHSTRSLMYQIAAEEYKIPVSQFHILRRLKDGNGSVSELSDCMHLSRSSISRSVDELVKVGYIKREHDKGDRRNINLTLTAEGEKIIKAMLDEIGYTLQEKFDSLTSSEQNEVARGLVLLGKVFMKREINSK